MLLAGGFCGLREDFVECDQRYAEAAGQGKVRGVVGRDPGVQGGADDVDRVDVIDTSRGAVVQRLPVAAGAHQLAFTATYAYVRHLETAEVTLIPLAQLSRPHTPALQRVAFGSKPPGEYAYPATAAAISAVASTSATLAR